MKNIQFLSSILMIGLLVSCGGNKSEKTGSESMKPETTTVSGDLGSCFTVVDRTYKITDNGGWNKLLTVELERTDSPLPFEITPNTEIRSYSYSMSRPFIQVGFGIEFLDEDGNVLNKVSASSSGLSASYNPDEAVDLVKLKSGEKGSIRFSVDSAAENATQFRISSSYTENEGYKSSSSSSSVGNDEVIEELSVIDADDDDDDDVDSSSDNDVDEFLAAYENYINNYISLIKKAKTGDAAAIADAASLLSDANEYGEKLQKMKSELTSSQLAKFNKLHQKLLKAVQ